MSLKASHTYEPPRGVLYTARVLSALTVALGAICYLPMRDGSLPVGLL